MAKKQKKIEEKEPKTHLTGLEDEYGNESEGEDENGSDDFEKRMWYRKRSRLMDRLEDIARDAQGDIQDLCLELEPLERQSSASAPIIALKERLLLVNAHLMFIEHMASKVIRNT